VEEAETEEKNTGPSVMEQETEKALLAQWQEGDEESFSRIVKAYLPKVVQLAYRYLKDRSLAEDVAQEIFLKLYQNPASWQPTARFSSWLYRVTFNACTDQWRKRKRNPESELLENQEISTANAAPDTSLIDKETAQLIQQAINALPEDQKKIILLYQEETSYEEIAEILGISVKGVERRLYRARNKLRHLLKHIVV